MHAIYLACLLGGALATALFAGLGAIGGGGHGGHHVGGAHGAASAAHHLGAAAHAHAGSAHHAGAPHGQASQTHAQAQTGHGHPARSHTGGSARGGLASTIAGWTLSWLSPLTVAAAALWFGGVGLIAEMHMGRVALVPAIVAGVVGAYLIRMAMATLVRADTPPLSLSAEGALATVNATIRPDAAGEVIFSLEGLTRSCPARSLDGTTILRGASVAIIKRERGMAWVTPIDSPHQLAVDDLDAQIAALAGTNGASQETAEYPTPNAEERPADSQQPIANCPEGGTIQ